MPTSLKRSALAFVCLLMLSTACVKSKKKFGFSSPHLENQLIVTLKDDTQRAAAKETFRAYSLNSQALNARSYLLKFDRNIDLEKMAERLAQRGDVAAVEVNQIYKLYETKPNDPSFMELWGLKNEGQLNGKAGVDIGAMEAWTQTTGRRDVLIGVLDSGIDYNHPDLKDNIFQNAGEIGLDANGQDKRTNGIDDDGNGLIDDWHGYDFFDNDNDPMDQHSHGTHVAGTIGATGDNGVGITGVNWNVTLVPIKVFSAGGATSTDALVRGIEYATSLGVFATNNSWGGGEYSEAIYGAIRKASEKNILFVAAAGNENDNNDVGLHYPANYEVENIITVAAINRRDELALFSNYGAKTVDVAAPGEDIFSTLPQGKYGLKSGTSMAAPHVTGSLGLIKAKFPDLDAQAIKAKLLHSTVRTLSLGQKTIHGRIHVANALEDDTIAPSVVSGLEITKAGINTLSLRWNPSGDDNDVGEASQYLIRFSKEPVVTEEEWALATAPEVKSLQKTEAGYAATLRNIAYNDSGYISVRSLDNVGNISALGESIPYALAKTTALWIEENEANHRWSTLQSPFGVRTVDGISMLSDSPDGFYPNGIEKSAISEIINLGTSELVLEIRHRYDLEKEFDFGYIDISVDSGKSWKTVGTVNGTSGWTDSSYELRSILGSSTAFQIRIRIKSDVSMNFEGWDIDSLRLIGVGP